MTVKNRIPRPYLKRESTRMSSCVTESVLPGTSFHAALSGCAQPQMSRWSPFRYILSLFQLSESQSKRTSSSQLARAWEWMHAKYTLSATKRLRVSETVTLGEKRFVAIVSVEGREFLIGGGTSGVSLLAHLGSPSKSEDRRLREFDVEGGAK